MCARSRSNKKKGFKKICNSETKCHSCKTSTKSMCFFPLERLPLHAEGDSIFRQLHQLQRYQLRFWKSIPFILNPSINPSLVTRIKRSHERISIRFFQVSVFLCQDLGLGWHQTPCFEAVSEIVEVIHRKVLELVELVIFSDVWRSEKIFLRHFEVIWLLKEM